MTTYDGFLHVEIINVSAMLVICPISITDISSPPMDDKQSTTSFVVKRVSSTTGIALLSMEIISDEYNKLDPKLSL